MTRPEIEPRSPGPLANTLTPRPMSGRFNPCQTAALDHYKSQPQIFLSPSVTLKIIKPFYYYLLQKSELYFFCFTTYTLRVSVFSCQYTLFLSDVVIGLSFKESQHGAGQCMVTFLEGAFDLFFHAVAVKLEGGGQGCGKGVP